MVVLLPGCWIQVEETSRLPSPEQMFPSVHWEKVSSVSEVVGFMMNRPLASQVSALKGQHEPDSEQPVVQSWIAPKLQSAVFEPHSKSQSHTHVQSRERRGSIRSEWRWKHRYQRRKNHFGSCSSSDKVCRAMPPRLQYPISQPCGITHSSLDSLLDKPTSNAIVLLHRPPCSLAID